MSNQDTTKCIKCGLFNGKHQKHCNIEDKIHSKGGTPSQVMSPRNIEAKIRKGAEDFDSTFNKRSGGDGGGEQIIATYPSCLNKDPHICSNTGCLCKFDGPDGSCCNALEIYIKDEGWEERLDKVLDACRNKFSYDRERNYLKDFIRQELVKVSEREYNRGYEAGKKIK